MKTNVERLTVALEETIRLQVPDSEEYKTWLHGPRESLLPPSLPRTDGSYYPTTDRAVRCIAEIVDDLLSNDKALGLSVSKDTAFQQAIRALGDNLFEIFEQADARAQWKTYRTKIRDLLSRTVASRTVYLPVWLFVRQEYEAFSVGPVQFVDRQNWLDKVEATEGQHARWREQVKVAWSTPSLQAAPSWFQRLRSLLPVMWRRRIKPPSSDPSLEFSVIARFAAPEQRIACVEVRGFDQPEAERRGLLATRIALDAIRLLVPDPHRARIFTGADNGPPRSVDRLSQIHGKGLTVGWSANRPGVGGAPNMARDLIKSSLTLFNAAGNCIKVAVTSTPSLERLPALAQRWNNAVHWYGRGCVADEEFVALPMFGFAMDILSGGKMEAGIRALACALFVRKEEDSITTDGTTLNAVVRKIYEYRSKIAHGSLLAVDLRMASERSLAASFANAMLYEYVVQLEKYRSTPTAVDDDTAFLTWLELNPSAAQVAPGAV